VSAIEKEAGQQHSQMVLAMVEDLLSEAGLEPAQLDGIAYGQGPGSFTGLRIACGVAQGLAFGAGVPVLGMGTLLALAESSGRDRVLAAIDARMNEVYLAAYEKTDGTWQVRHEPGLYPPAALPDIAGEGYTGCGNGFAAFGPALLARYGGQLREVLEGHFPSARHMASLAAPRFAAGEGLDAALAAPVYIRDKVALTTAERRLAK
jgi:tRNA threonylcarbamoyladenosine biosynthesis protein TsaB